jgi:hypothetical protein
MHALQSSRAMPQPVAIHTVPSEYLAYGEDLDEVHWMVWEALRPLFPSSAIASQPKAGWISITWPTAGQPEATFSFAAPILVRLEADLLDSMRKLPSRESRRQLALQQLEAVKAGLRGYEPYACVPNARVIVLG